MHSQLLEFCKVVKKTYCYVKKVLVIVRLGRIGPYFAQESLLHTVPKKGDFFVCEY